MVYGKESFAERLMPLLGRLCSDGDDEVRGTIAAGFHEIVQMRPDEPALVESFIELIRGGAPEVVQQMTDNLNRTLPPLYECIKRSVGTPNMVGSLGLYQCVLKENHSNPTRPDRDRMQSPPPEYRFLAKSRIVPEQSRLRPSPYPLS